MSTGPAGGAEKAYKLGRIVPLDHPLRAVQSLVAAHLASLHCSQVPNPDATEPQAVPDQGRLIRAILLQALYSIENPTALASQLQYNSLFRWFVGLHEDEIAWTAASYEKLRAGLLASPDARIRLRRLFDALEKNRLMDSAEFTPDPNLIGSLPADSKATSSVKRIAQTAGCWVADVTFILVIIGLSCIQLRWLFSYPMEFDAAVNAVIAKNLAFGRGYVSIVGNVFPYGVYREVRPFPPEVTTGPGLVLPAAVFIRVLGNRYWVPGLTAMVVSSSALIAAFLVLRRRLGKPWLAGACAGGALLLGVLVICGLPGAVTVLFSFVGEWSSAAYLILGNVLLFSGGLRNAAAGRPGLAQFLGFFFLACAYVTKALAAMPVLVALALFCVAAWRLAGGASHWKWRTLWPVGGFLGPLLVLELWRILAIGSISQWRTAGQMAAYYYDWAGSGMGPFKQAAKKLPYVFERTAANWKTFSGWMKAESGAWLFVLLCGFAVGVCIWLLRGELRRPGMRPLGPLLTSSSLVLGSAWVLVWWFTLSTLSFPRHFVLPVLPMSLGIALLCVTAPGRLRAALVAGCVVLMLGYYTDVYPPCKADIVTVISRGLPKPSPPLESQLRGAVYLTQLRGSSNVVLLGCLHEVMPELDYLMPGTGNFASALGWHNPAPGNNTVYLVRRADWSSIEGCDRVQKSCPDLTPSPPLGEGLGSLLMNRCPPGTSAF